MRVHSLFWKGMLAFLAVILVAVGAVALLVRWTTEDAFRRYAATHGGAWNRQVMGLTAYYATNGSWEGVQDVLTTRPWGQGLGGRGVGPPQLDFQLADGEGRLIGDTSGVPFGSVSQEELEAATAIEVDGQVVGYLLPSTQVPPALPLDQPQEEFLTRFRTALWVAVLVALVAALVVGGLLFRSIVAPLRRLTAASHAIAEGNLSTRASVRGKDEVSRLATSFNQMAESLQRAEEARRSQTADIAHELRTPLTVLQGTLEAMLDGVYPADRENLLGALFQVRTLTRLVGDLRLLALADAGRLRLQKVPLDLRTFLQEVVEAHRPQAQRRGVTLALETPPALPLVLADRDRMAQVMGNLLSNGLHYVPEGGHVTVRVTDGGREVTVAVADDGSGVSPEDLPHLFERFWRGDPTRRRATGGSGLGLAIARYIVEAHGGRIWAKPTAGGGLTVAFTLRAAALA
jgi:two-component system sensor histidine kinase BaeS